ncbi:MAG: hypothetical protein H0W23_03495 [Chloroflexia bacterium]|nr:hypothetical protein [Chloroflexia bacterium]
MRDGAIAGLAGGAAMAVCQEIDMRVFRYPSDDFVLLGGVFGKNRGTSRRIGMVMHTVNSAAVGTVYGLTAANVSSLPGPVKGIVFALIENTVLYPLLLAENRHPAIKSGLLVTYRSKTAFAQEVLRHIVFGAVTGAIYARLTRR